MDSYLFVVIQQNRVLWLQCKCYAIFYVGHPNEYNNIFNIDDDSDDSSMFDWTL